MDIEETIISIFQPRTSTTGLLIASEKEIKILNVYGKHF